MNRAEPIVYGIFAIYLGAVVLSGKAQPFVEMMRQDAEGYIPWILGVVALVLLYGNDTTRPVAAPFALLVLLNTFLRNYPIIRTQFREITGV